MKQIPDNVARLIDRLDSEGLLSRDDSDQVIEAIVGYGLDVDMNRFISVIRDNQLCGDMSRVEVLARQSRGAAVVKGKSCADWLTGWPGFSSGSRDELVALLKHARSCGCSDVHVVAGAVPLVRRYKSLYLLETLGVVSQELSEALNCSLLSDDERYGFLKDLELDFSRELGENERYRVNLLKQRNGISGSYRIIESRIPKICDLGVRRPEILEKLAAYGQGLILITGPAGSGKSTTMNALVQRINATRHDHVITVEDPIEFVHCPDCCNITQRELHRDTKSFGNALRAALREDPDVIVIGEMRDLETIEMAIHASETGHLVIGTLHTSNASDTMSRILDVFPASQQGQIRSMVAESLKGIICQQLVPKQDGSGCRLAVEILLGTLAVSNLIREGKTYQLQSTLQTSRNAGMCTMEQSFFDLYMDGDISYEQARGIVKSQDMLRQMAIKEASRM